jgi:hypothetical protein
VTPSGLISKPCQRSNSCNEILRMRSAKLPCNLCFVTRWLPFMSANMSERRGPLPPIRGNPWAAKSPNCPEFGCGESLFQCIVPPEPDAIKGTEKAVHPRSVFVQQRYPASLHLAIQYRFGSTSESWSPRIHVRERSGCVVGSSSPITPPLFPTRSFAEL